MVERGVFTYYDFGVPTIYGGGLPTHIIKEHQIIALLFQGAYKEKRELDRDGN